MEVLGRFTFDEYCDEVARFHGSAAPGVVLGGFLVEAARGALPPGTLFEALCETRVCLADAVQLLTPCTTGNGRLKIVHVGRFALVLYDKYTGAGVRAFLDDRLLDPWPEIRAWYTKKKSKAEQDGAQLLRELRDAGRSVAGLQRVTVTAAFLKKKKLGPVQPCPACGEGYPLSDGDRCGGCRGELPYTLQPV